MHSRDTTVLCNVMHYSSLFQYFLNLLRHFLGPSDIEQQKIKPVAVAILELHRLSGS